MIDLRRLIQHGLWLALLLALLAGTRWLLAGGASFVTGQASVIDGDSLRVDGHEVRLQGIDAPEGRQTCQRDDTQWPCGQQSRAALEDLTRGRRVSCRSNQRDQHGRLLADCDIEGRSVNAAMVENGWAINWSRKHQTSYRAEELAARKAKRGLWQGSFENPSEWRRKNRTGT